jgi:hypothetical protein
MRIVMGTAALLSALSLGTPTPQPAAQDAVQQAVVLHLTLPDKTEAKIVVRTGETARVKVAELGALGLTPRVTNDVLTIEVAEVTKDAVSGLERLQSVKSVELLTGQKQRVEHSTIGLDIVWVATKSVPVGSAEAATGDAASGPSAALSSPVPMAPCRNCCVQCGANIICACLVDMSCGFCCCPMCCDLMEGAARPAPVCSASIAS